MAEFGNTTVQTVNPGEVVIFTITSQPSLDNRIRHAAGEGGFLLSGGCCNRNRCGSCRCCYSDTLAYLCTFGCNIAIPTGGTVEPISIALAVEGNTVPGTTATVTPAAVEEYWNVSRSKEVDIWKGCCQSVSLRNVSNQPILVDGSLNMIITPPSV